MKVLDAALDGKAPTNRSRCRETLGILFLLWLMLLHSIAYPAASDSRQSLVKSIQQMRAETDAKIRRGEPSEFSAVWSRYLRPGESAVLGLKGNRLNTDPESKVPMKEGRLPDRGIRIRYERGAPWASPTGSGKPVLLGKRVLAEEEKVPWGGRLHLGSLTVIVTEQSGTARLVVYDPREPVRRGFHRLRYYPVDLRYRFLVTLKPLPNPRLLRLASSRGLEKEYLEYGLVDFTPSGKRQRLYVYVPANESAHPSEYFVPFRDATSGKESYLVARYVDLKPEAGGRFLLDFNLAYNPSCAYSTHFNCPIPPRKNTLKIPIRAGEMRYH